MKVPKITKTTIVIRKYSLESGVIFERVILSVWQVKRSFYNEEGKLLPRGEAERMCFNHAGEDLYNRNK